MHFDHKGVAKGPIHLPYVVSQYQSQIADHICWSLEWNWRGQREASERKSMIPSLTHSWASI